MGGVDYDWSIIQSVKKEDSSENGGAKAMNKQYIEDVVEWLKGMEIYLETRQDGAGQLNDELHQLLEWTSGISEEDLSASEIEQLQQRIHILHHNVTKLSQKDQEPNLNKSVPIGKHILPAAPIRLQCIRTGHIRRNYETSS